MRKLSDGVEFVGYGPCGAFETRYPVAAGGGRAIVLAWGDPEESEENEMLAVATVNVPGVSETLPDDEVVVKNYSGHEGMLAALVEAGVVEDTGKRASFGHVEGVPVARVLG